MCLILITFLITTTSEAERSPLPEGDMEASPAGRGAAGEAKSSLPGWRDLPSLIK